MSRPNLVADVAAILLIGQDGLGMSEHRCRDLRRRSHGLACGPCGARCR